MMYRRIVRPHRIEHWIILALSFLLFITLSYRHSAPTPTLPPPPPQYAEQYHYPIRDYEILVIVKSAAEHSAERALLRSRSWLSHSWGDGHGGRVSWRYLFLVGRSMDPEASADAMRAEQEKYGDLIVAPYLDEFARQTYKVVWGMRHALENFTFDFLFVVDEDVVVNVKDLNSYVKTLRKSRSDVMFFGGSECRARRTERSGMFAVSRDTWPYDSYPTVCDGSALLYSRDTVVEIIRVWRTDRQPVVPLDDIHIGIIVFISGKIQITTVPGFGFGCDGSRNDFVMQHIQPIKTGVDLFEQYLRRGVYCDKKVLPHPRRNVVKLSGKG